MSKSAKAQKTIVLDLTPDSHSLDQAATQAARGIEEFTQIEVKTAELKQAVRDIEELKQDVKDELLAMLDRFTPHGVYGSLWANGGHDGPRAGVNVRPIPEQPAS